MCVMNRLVKIDTRTELHWDSNVPTNNVQFLGSSGKVLGFYVSSQTSLLYIKHDNQQRTH